MTSERPIPQVSTLLPKDARDLLIEAAQTRNPWDRTRAVQEAIDRVKRRYPQFFQPEKELTP